MPHDIEVLERRAIQLEIEIKALEKEQDPASRARVAEVSKELASLREESDRLKARGSRRRR